jgi:glycosyltransferase involved in cell wall biosynthesis
VTVIRNSVPDVPRTRPAGWLRAELGLPPDRVLAVGVGSLIVRKRVDLQLQALARIRERAPQTVLVLVGDGPERSRLEAQAREPRLAGRVRFLGRRDDVREILPECDVLLHTASAEGSAYAIPEAMASALPAVVMRAGAADEQVRDGETGCVVESNDTHGFAERFAELAGDPALRRRFGAAARARWQAEYRVEVAARRYHELYRSLCCA